MKEYFEGLSYIDPRDPENSIRVSPVVYSKKNTEGVSRITEVSCNSIELICDGTYSIEDLKLGNDGDLVINLSHPDEVSDLKYFFDRYINIPWYLKFKLLIIILNLIFIGIGIYIQSST